MQTPILGWGSLILGLCIVNFGAWWTFIIIFYIAIFLLGGLLFLYITNEDDTRSSQQKLSSDVAGGSVIRSGLRKVLDEVARSTPLPRYDKRLTGSHLIDQNLQEIIGYLIRDYIYPWYDLISDDDEFCYYIRETGQRVIVNVAARMKEVDWIPYLTTRLVDDAASHLRLYHQACAKTRLKLKKIEEEKQKTINDSYKPQTLQSFKTTTEQSSAELKQHHCHSRNPSGSNIQALNSTNHSRNNSSSGLSNNAGKSSEGALKNWNVKNSSVDEDSSSVNLESIFFDLEVAMEKNMLCRDFISTDKDQEKRFLQDFVNVLLFLLLPPSDFHCLSLRFIVRDLLVGGVLLPLFNILTDPDYINLTIIWLCKDFPMTPEAFLLTLRTTDSADELQATREIVSREISFLRSRDSGGDDDAIIKQQLNSLLYVRKALDNRLGRLNQGSDNDSSGNFLESLGKPGKIQPPGISADNLLVPGAKLVTLPLDFILKHNVALSYLIDYMTGIQYQSYLFLYLNIEGWKVSVEQLLDDRELQRLGNSEKVKDQGDVTLKKETDYGTTLEGMKEAARSIYNQYLSEKAITKIKVDEELVTELLDHFNSNIISDSWFDKIQASIYCKLQNNEKFLPGFYKSSNYVKLLSELELLKDNMLVDDNDEDTHSLDNLSLSDNASLLSLETADSAEQGSDDSEMNSGKTKEPPASHGEGNFFLAAEIIDTGVVQDRGKTYGIYALFVSKTYENGFTEKWHVYRRYSDFYDLQQKVKETYSNLGKLTFPGKKTFHNMDRAILEKRMKMLNDYLQILLQSGVAETHSKLLGMLLTFLEPGEYDKSSGPFAKTFDTLVNPLKSSMRTVGQAVRTMPDNLLNTVDEVFDGITKVFQNRSKHFDDPMKVGSSLHQETDDNIPLRIMLLLMDEVFDLKSRNQWLRRRIVTLLRQIIRTMFGDIVNKKILDYVALLTCPEQVASYLDRLKQSMWPNGIRVIPSARDESTRLRTRVMAKTALLSSLSDELKHIIGSETTRRGLMRVFHLFQHPVLNRRILYVLMEGILETLFPQHNLPAIFQKLHSRSPRVGPEALKTHFKSTQ